MTMTPEQAYDELSGLYILATKNRDFTDTAIKVFATTYISWAEANIRAHRWTYRNAEIMVNRCRELVPLALQHQP